MPEVDAITYWERQQKLAEREESPLSDEAITYYFGVDVEDYTQWLKTYVTDHPEEFSDDDLDDFEESMLETIDDLRTDYDYGLRGFTIGEIARISLNQVKPILENRDSAAIALVLDGDFGTQYGNIQLLTEAYNTDWYEDNYDKWEEMQLAAFMDEFSDVLSPREFEFYDSNYEESYDEDLHELIVYNTNGDYMAIVEKSFRTTADDIGAFVFLVNKTEEGFKVLETVYYEY